MRPIILVGLGPHARRIYYRFLEKHRDTYGITIPLVIELLESQGTVMEFLDRKALQPEKIVYLPGDARMGTLHPDALNALDSVKHQYPNVSMIIATEPKAHVEYARWALRNDVDILMDKPISAPLHVSTDRAASDEILYDYTLLEKELSTSRSRFIIQCQRRYHKGYTHIWQYLNKFVYENYTPITYMDIYHADGMWNMPDELHYREGHPYKYGYGKLLHSGYHFVDLYAWFNGINKQLLVKQPRMTEVIGRKYTPDDHALAFDQNDYKNIFLIDFSESLNKGFEGYGELDVYALLQSRAADGRVVSTANITLQQNSFSRRAWPNLPKDTYKGNGRVRHERFSVQVGPLLNIQVHSYQSHEVLKTDTDATGVGNEDHFDIYIFRNTGMVGGEALEKISLGESMKSKNESGYMGHNEKAREQCLLDWLDGKENNSDFLSHKETNIMLASIYGAIASKTPQYVTHA